MTITKYLDFLELKNIINAECDRRVYVHSNSISLESYGSESEYDYIIIPNKNSIIYKEHYKKILIPLQKFNSIFNNYNLDENIITQDLLLQADSFLEIAKNTNTEDNSHTDCSNNSCTGLCYNTCISTCGENNCTSSCGGSTCSGSCSGDPCSSSCSGECGGLCDDDCYSTCSGDCSRLCADNDCSANCASGCGGYCDHVQCADNYCTNYTYVE